MWLTAPQALPVNPYSVSPSTNPYSSMETDSYTPIVPLPSEISENSESSSNNAYQPCSGFARRKASLRKGCSSISASDSTRPPMFPIPWAGTTPIPRRHQGSISYLLPSQTRGSKAAQWVKQLFSKFNNSSSADFVAASSFSNSAISFSKLKSKKIPFYYADGEYYRSKTLDGDEIWLPPVKLNTLRLPVQTNATVEHPPLPSSPFQKGISPAFEVTTRTGADKASMPNTNVPNSNDDEQLMPNVHFSPSFSSEEKFPHFPEDQTTSERYRSSSNVSQFSGYETSSTNSIRVADWHPGFNYEANFTCYYNYYPAEEYLEALPRQNEEDCIETHNNSPVEETNNSVPKENLIHNEPTLPPTPLSNNISRKSSVHKTEYPLANTSLSSFKKKKVQLETKNAKESGSKNRRQSSFSSISSNKQSDRSGIKANKDESAKTKTQESKGRASRLKATAAAAEIRNDESSIRNRRIKENQSSSFQFSPPPATNTTAPTTSSFPSSPESFNTFNLTFDDSQADQKVRSVTPPATHADANLRSSLKSARRLRSCCNIVGGNEADNINQTVCD